MRIGHDQENQFTAATASSPILGWALLWYNAVTIHSSAGHVIPVVEIFRYWGGCRRQLSAPLGAPHNLAFFPERWDV